MKQVTVVLCCIFSLELHALNKASFDVIAPNSTLAKSMDVQNGHFGSKSVSNAVFSYSMMIGGYFTMGTTAGMTSSPFDDKCTLSFGHPYALTSFPFFAIDGVWMRLDEIMHDLTRIMPGQNGDTLLIQVDLFPIYLTFQLEPGSFDNTFNITLRLHNSDTKVHNLGLGLMFDPALGQWGDGHVKINDQFVDKIQDFDTSDLADFEIWERHQQPYGLGISVNLADNKPDKMILANWAELYADLEPEFIPNPLQLIYDLCLKLVWREREIQPQSEVLYRLTVRLLQPDFSSQVFMRWNMPSALSMENGILFPRTLNTIVRAMNTGSSPLNNLSIDVQFPDEFEGTLKSGTFSVAPQSSAFENLAISSKERYEDMIVPITLNCMDNSRLYDRLTRTIFIPATPVSDEGLTVAIDSIITNNYPEVSLVFQAEKEETGQRLLNLHKENIFLYENEQRVHEFVLDKFGGGSRLVDVCFVLDCSGSMGDNIADVRDHLGEFADSLREGGFDFRVAVVTFSTTVDDVWDFTNDIELMKQRLAGIVLWGGEEDSPSALYKASELSWRPGSKRTIIWVTDEPYPEHNFTQEQIVNRMLEMDIRVHGVGAEYLQTDWFNPIILPTGGNFYDIYGNFRDILLDVARMDYQDRYIVTFQLTTPAPHSIRLKIHYAGLGGQTQIFLQDGGASLAKKLICFPNPFNPVIKIMVDAFDAVHGQVRVYNILGQNVRSFPLTPHQSTEIVWNAKDENGLPVSSGFYIITLSMQTTDGHVENISQKVFYLK
ncbi:VWA domain-containing protein [candidate division KSB1 bacterium]|nr:VWA domain-containing protein [candidate division KSB1 bacterium]RQW05024.1 MAG: VWA domain-containing protein [candidate division KSB1 bacterium]